MNRAEEDLIGSIIKQFTAAAILLLQEQGKLSVSDPVCKFFSDCPPAWKELTLHHLLAHTSGVPDFANANPKEFYKKMHLRETNESMIARFKNLPLEFKPGSKHAYSNSGYFLLGVIIEKASGESYDHFLRQHIFAPLQMNDSGVYHNDADSARRAVGYEFKEGKLAVAAYFDISQLVGVINFTGDNGLCGCTHCSGPGGAKCL